jgi:hypothetical protein
MRFILLNPENNNNNENLIAKAKKKGVTPLPAIVNIKIKGENIRKPLFEIYGWTGESHGKIGVLAKLNLSLAFRELGKEFFHSDGSQVWAHQGCAFDTSSDIGDELKKWKNYQEKINSTRFAGKHTEVDLTTRNKGVNASFAHIISDFILIEVNEKVEYNQNSGFHFYRFSYDLNLESAKVVYKGVGSSLEDFAEQVPEWATDLKSFLNNKED